MALNIEAWDERIRKDYDRIMSGQHQKWMHNRDVMNNENKGSRFGNLTKEFAGAVRARLIHSNFFIKVSSDDPDYAKKSGEITIMANSLSRTISLKEALDDATEESLWAGTGWLEIGHSLDLHSFDPMRTVLFKNENQFDPADVQDEYVPVSEEEVQADIGDEIEKVPPFDPFSPPPEPGADEGEPQLTFDPDFGTPWIKTVSPFFICLPLETKKFKDADYVTKFVVISKPELALLSDTEIPDNVSYDISRFQTLIDETPGGEFIEEPVVIGITFIRRDRNDPRYSGWYLAHVIGNPDIVLKSSVNPYGGMIPIIPAKSRSPMRIVAKSWIEDLRPYTDMYGKAIEGFFRRIRLGLNVKWSPGANASVDATNARKINNPDYNGQVKMESGSSEEINYLEPPPLSQDHIAALNILTKLAQGEAGQTDIDRGTPIKKITARQTDALLQTSELMMNAIRGPIVKAGNEAVLKVIHLLNLFSAPRGHVYKFGAHVVEVEPGGNDYTTSYQYAIEVKDLEGPAQAEDQLLLIQFLGKVAVIPHLSNHYNWQEIANEGRRRMGFGIETMASLIPQGQPGLSQPGGPPPGNVLSMGGGETHPERMLGDQGSDMSASMPNALSGMNNI